MEFEISESFDWAESWLSVGIDINKQCFVCVATHDGENLEIGVRKHPTHSSVNKEFMKVEMEKISKSLPYTYTAEYNRWWFLENSVKNPDNIEEIVSMLTSLKEEIEGIVTVPNDQQ